MSKNSNGGSARFHSSLKTPLLSFGGQHWCIGDAAEATAVWGAPGSGKTSGSGRMIAKSFLAANMGGLVLCAKIDEADTWRRYVKEAGREQDLIVIDASGAQRFNILDYAAKTIGGPGFEQNLVFLMQTMIEATRVATGAGGDGDNRYFTDGALKWVSHAFPLLLLVEGTLRLSDLSRFIATMPTRAEMRPTSPAELELKKEWLQSYCAQVHFKAGEIAEKAGPSSYAMQIVNEHGDFFLTEVANLDNRPRSSIESTLTNMIYPFLSGKLGELFCTSTTVTPEVCRQDGKIIVMDIPVLKYGTTGAVAQTIFKYIFGVVAQNTRVTEQTRPIFLYADEAQFFLVSTDDDLLSTARSSKTCIVYLTQDLPTYYTRLGAGARDKAEAILSKFGTRIFHANSSRETNNYGADLIGKVQKFHVGKSQSKSRSTGMGGNHQDNGLGYNANAGASINMGESMSGYLDHEVSPDYFSTKLRNGTKANKFKVDAIVIRNAKTWRRTKRHWIKAEFSQT